MVAMWITHDRRIDIPWRLVLTSSRCYARPSPGGYSYYWSWAVSHIYWICPWPI
ncbi:hypothetical protein BDV40DRAFT_280209 [Aspergillus tamarii]|uniref:Uncharacterized protein n=1 Tax=Aspergillus tamarii TaxID=41984 RepID=A0A5N6UDU1_ASPTM|nr:hypothetical protein BDV40DRAFT_280209 [Aspergillus tamarii]